MEIDQMFEKGVTASTEIFSNTVWVNMLVPDEKNIFDTQVYNVAFEPSARTHWHSHPGGQILLCLKGSGCYQEKGKPSRILIEGDIVEILPDVVHWHGASPSDQFIHLGMSTQVHRGPAEWMGPVTDEEYEKAVSK